MKAGDTALVLPAAGGVGQLLVQVAKMSGARVIAVTSIDEKVPVARRAGADEVIVDSLGNFAQEVRRLTSGKGVDVVYDGVGQKTFLSGMDCLRPRGMMVLFGQASGKVEPLDPLILVRKGSLYLTRPSIGHYLRTSEEFRWRATDLFKWIRKGNLRVRIDKTFRLQEAPKAHQYMEAGKTVGKVLLIP